MSSCSIQLDTRRTPDSTEDSGHPTHIVDDSYIKKRKGQLCSSFIVKFMKKNALIDQQNNTGVIQHVLHCRKL